MEAAFIALGQVLVAMFAATVGWLTEQEDSQKTFNDLLHEALGAALSGILTFFAYKWLNLNIYLAFFLAGLIGNQGAKGISIVKKLFAKDLDV